MVLIPCLLGALFWAVPFKGILRFLVGIGCNKGVAVLLAFVITTTFTGLFCILISSKAERSVGAKAGFLWMPLFGVLLCCIYRN